MNLLVITPQMPRPNTSAGDQRLLALLRMLADEHAVDLLAMPRDPTASGGDGSALAAAGVRVLATAAASPLEWALRRRPYDAAIFEFWHTVPQRVGLVRRLQPWCHVIVDTVDLHYLRDAGGVRVGAVDAQLAAAQREAERSAYLAADRVVAVTDLDEAELRSFLPAGVARLIPLVIPPHARPADAQRRPVLSFVGGGRHLPNVDGIVWFADEVFPLVRAPVPEATLEIVGADLPAAVVELAARPGVVVVGPVPQTEPYLDRAAVSVAPLRYGAGMKGKVASAMAAAVPVVTTTVGAQGLGPVTPEQLAVADDPAGMADRIVELLRDPARAEAIGRAGQAWIDAICGPAVVRAKLRELIGLVPPRPSTWRLRFAAVRVGLSIRDAVRAAAHAVPMGMFVVRRVRTMRSGRRS